MNLSRLLHYTRFLFVFLCLAGPVFGQGGNSGLSFLKIGVGSRALAMGETGVAGESLGTSLFYNPANSARDTEASIGFMHNAWIQDVATEYFGAVVPLEGWSLGVQLGLNSVSNIEIRQVPGEAQGTTEAKGFFGGISAAVRITDGVDAGVTAKYLFEKIYLDVADGYAFDFGLRWTPASSGELANLRAGIALLNIGSMSALKNEASQLPEMLRYGVAYVMTLPEHHMDLTLEAAGLTLFQEKSTHLSLGAELDYGKMLFLRAGYQSGYEVKSVSAGIGAMYSGVRFDYAFIPFRQSFGIAHAVTVSVLF